MARAYGFRVFLVEAFPNRAKGNEAIAADVDSGLPEEVTLLLERIKARGTQRFEPTPDADGNFKQPVKTATITFVELIKPGIIHVTLSVGEEGSHAKATKPKKKAKNLLGWSAEADHEVSIIFPSAPDSRFLLATQTYRRRDPHQRLLSMLRTESIVLRQERTDRDKSVREEAKARGEKAPKVQKFKRLAFASNQASDNDYLDEILTGADAATVVFKSKAMDAKGAVDYIDRVLQIKLRDQNIIDVGRAVSRTWANAWRSGGGTSQRDAVSEVSDLLIERDLLDEGEQDHYESAAINVRGKTEASTTIAVDTLRDAFTYPLSDLRPQPYAFYDKVASRVAKIAAQEDLEIEAIDAHEVARCLTESHPGGL
ncbi:hypothetical protein [Clavibacter sp. Sh2126]|uniref:hypothetical protein n=1 Tax=Clavibacter sp. Sh2126 TaxID=3397678 RepID=UPI0039E1632B